MASQTGLNHTAAYVTNPAGKFGKGEYNGEVLCLYDEITLVSELSIGQTVKMGRLPIGARVLEATIKSPALTAGTLELGHAASADAVESALADAFVAATSFASAGQAEGTGVSILKRFAAEVDVQLQATVATTAGVGLTVRTCIKYIID